ncbi:MAG: hypothetical protein WKG03_00415 [Telluria sp.]
MTQATLTLRTAEGDGLDGLQMDVDYHGPFDPSSTAHNTIGYLAGMLIEQADKAKALHDAPRIALLEGTNV